MQAMDAREVLNRLEALVERGEVAHLHVMLVGQDGQVQQLSTLDLPSERAEELFRSAA